MSTQTPNTLNFHWLNSLNLLERRNYEQNIVEHHRGTQQRAEARLKSWKGLDVFSSPKAFARRLEVEGFSEENVLPLLEDNFGEEPNETTLPEWVRDFNFAFEHFGIEEFRPYFFFDEYDDVSRTHELVQAVAHPLISWGLGNLLHEIQPILRTSITSELYDEELVRKIFLTQLIPTLTRKMERSLALELHIARLEGLLRGDTSRERHTDFLEHVLNGEAAKVFFCNYPVLARQVTSHIKQLTKNCGIFLQRLNNDFGQIRQTFFQSTHPGTLVSVFAAGDFHKGGLTVLILEFSSGAKLVYKPRSLAAEIHFQRLLHFLNQHGADPEFRCITFIDGDNYGWVEFVESKPCSSAEEIKRFYKRQGANLALLYMLGASDINSENIKASGEHPVILDLEVLFRPRWTRRMNEVVLYESVLGSTLLPPLRQFIDEPKIDVSGMRYQEGQVSPLNIPLLENQGTDEVLVVRKHPILPDAENLPQLETNIADARVYADEVLIGFEAMYHLLNSLKTELLSADGPIRAFGSDTTRVIIRDTIEYIHYLDESLHPDLLRNAVDQDIHFDLLWDLTNDRPYIERVFTAERQDLLNGDIPIFTTRPDSPHIWTSNGDRIPNFLHSPGLKLTLQRIDRLGASDFKRQRWLLEKLLLDTSGYTQILHSYELDHVGVSARDAKTTPVTRERLLATACLIGDRLDELAWHDEVGITWFGVNNDEHGWEFSPMGLFLYEGLSGVSLFFANLGKMTNEERYVKLAHRTLDSLRQQVFHDKNIGDIIGGFVGWGSIIYTFLHLSRVWNDISLIDEAEELAISLPPLIEKDQQLDVLSGTVGCLAALDALYAVRPTKRTKQLIIQCGDKLIREATQLEGCIAWSTRSDPIPLTGFSHGVSGYAWSLFKAGEVSGEPHFIEAAHQAINYERRNFSQEFETWYDLRPKRVSKDGKPLLPYVAWCNGAPGIGLVRLHCFQHLQDSTTMFELEKAFNVTVQRGFGINHSLCHGDLGNLELFLAAQQKLGQDWQKQINQVSQSVVASIEDKEWRCGTPFLVESSGFMTGLAGIGYGLLRICDPVSVPSVLMLELPP
jgi:type 2 lantibiotic biosynthesis protein LanM